MNTSLVADAQAEALSALASDPRSDADGADTSGLCAEDAAGLAVGAEDGLVEAELRHLRRLSAARLARQHEHPWGTERRD